MSKHIYNYKQNYNSRKSFSAEFKPRSLRKVENKARRNLVLIVIIIVVLLYTLVSWGLPALIGGLSYFNKLKPASKNSNNQVQIDEAIAPPVLNIPFDATNSATLRVSGYSTANTKVEIYFDDKLKDTVTVNNSGLFTTKAIPLSVGINNILGQTVAADGKKSYKSKVIQLVYNNEKPKLEVTAPQDGMEVLGTPNKVKVTGTTAPDNSITVNNITVIVNNQGQFETNINLNEGENTINVIATDEVGNTTQIERKVIYTAATPTPSPSPSPSPVN